MALNQDLDSKCSTLIKENRTLQSAKQLLEHETGQLTVRLSEANEKFSLLSYDNKIILQEKAMLQGQFKQLQDSM